MPTLNWIGKDAVIEHHKHVPLRLLECDRELSAGDPDAGNLLIQGDNLEALKALLPRYKGQVKCIYIDPPYNTGNEGWIYNDNVNDPRIKKWLGDVVGKEAEDLCRHDKWLCMMYPRLALLREFLTPDGAVFISIDDNEAQNLRAIVDEIFGVQNFIATIVWQKIFSPKNSARHFSESHDYVVVYAIDADRWRPNLLVRDETAKARYKNPDNDLRGPWSSGDCSARNFYGAGTYPIKCPSGRVIAGPPRGMYWRYSEPEFKRMDADGRIWWGRSGDNVPRIKRFLSEVKEGVVPQTIWMHSEVGNTQEAKKEVLSVVDFDTSRDVFITPKPTRLLRRVIEIGSDPDSLIMDSFAGSGTTGHAVLQANKVDGGHRRFILVEIDSGISQDVTRQRLQRAALGHSREGEEPVAPLGSGFRYCRLGKTLFDEHGEINKEVPFTDLARYVYLIETGVPAPTRPRKDNPLLGVHEGRAVYLLYNGVLGDKRPAGGNVLTRAVLEALPPHPNGADGPRVIYGEACRLSESTLGRLKVSFRQTPYALREG